MLVRALARLLLTLFYRRIRIHGIERVPRHGPLIVCANHHGSLIDPLVLIAHLPRNLRPLAKAPLFRNPLLRVFLQALGALPVVRPQDRQLVHGSNRQMIEMCQAALAGDGALLIFPEGLSKPQPVLSPLRPGAARLALDAEAAAGYSLGVHLLPVAIHLRQAHRYRRGEIDLEIGAPIAAAELAATHARDGEAAVVRLLDRLERALKERLLEVTSAADLDLLRLAAAAWARADGRRPSSTAELALGRAFARAYRRLRAHHPARLDPVRETARDYAEALDHFHLDADDLDLRYRPGPVTWFLLRRGAGIVASLPVVLAGGLVNAVPRRLATLVAARFSATADSWASAQLVVAVAVFPLCWILGAIAVALGLGLEAGLVTLAASPLLGLAALYLARDHHDFRSRIRAFLLLAGATGLRRHLEDMRRRLHDAVEDLRPELEGEPSGDGPGGTDARDTTDGP